MPEPTATPTAPTRGTDWGDVLLPFGLIAGLILLLQLDLDPLEVSRAGAEDREPLEAWLELLVGYLAAGAEIAAALVIGAGVARAVWQFARRSFSRHDTDVDATEGSRLQLGRMLALGLEFTLASDILRTAVAPTREDILTLGTIVLLRTLLNIFLEREIRGVEERRARARHSPAGVLP